MQWSSENNADEVPSEEDGKDVLELAVKEHLNMEHENKHF